MGIKCKCAWGTSKPTVTMPTLLQEKLFSIAAAMGFANINNSLKYASGISNILSTRPEQKFCLVLLIDFS